MRKKILLNSCEDCPHMKIEEYTSSIGVKLPRIFFKCNKTDLYVRGFKIYQNKDRRNTNQFKKLFQYCPLHFSEREFLKWEIDINE